MRYADIIIDNKSRHTDSLYTYKTEDTAVKAGDRVRIPFGMYNKERSGYVYRISSEEESADNSNCPPEKMKTILGVDDSLPLTEEIMTTAGWMKQRYGITYWDCVRCFIPAGGPAREGKEKDRIRV